MDATAALSCSSASFGPPLLNFPMMVVWKLALIAISKTGNVLRFENNVQLISAHIQGRGTLESVRSLYHPAS